MSRRELWLFHRHRGFPMRRFPPGLVDDHCTVRGLENERGKPGPPDDFFLKSRGCQLWQMST